ncbi:putative 2-oxo-4-hydroxy-4-carboxy-5-ureidoimidazoline decarboxylase isoform X3 [Macaca fascicularis]|uniref:putative 2-oxo-4-hydroxy-4-carboxy-5-ureidoimidazoline decarboxylase isoform X3 n=1 Tax=Macaca fascicularis TaxID=9541 RepID=UPI0032B05728
MPFHSQIPRLFPAPEPDNRFTGIQRQVLPEAPQSCSTGFTTTNNDCFCLLGQEGILRCHPDLAGSELRRGTLTAESQREQSAAGLTSLGADERLRLAELNAQYRARFGFPFVLAARFSDRAAVSRELARRLLCPSAQELRTALGEVKKIGSLRLADLLRADPAKL